MWKNRDHMMAGVRAAHASPSTPAHLRPHLARRLKGGGNVNSQPPRKVIAGPLGRSPIKVTARRTSATPIKTLVGATARPPIKTTVGRLAAPPPKTLVRSTAAPPLKSTPGNLGTGGIQPLGRGFDTKPNSSSNPFYAAERMGNGDGNKGTGVGSGMRPAGGPPNPVLENADSSGTDQIVGGGMGATAKSMSRAPGRGRSRRSMFFGG